MDNYLWVSAALVKRRLVYYNFRMFWGCSTPRNQATLSSYNLAWDASISIINVEHESDWHHSRRLHQGSFPPTSPGSGIDTQTRKPWYTFKTHWRTRSSNGGLLFHGMDWTGPNSHTILWNGPDKLDVTWGAQLLPIIQARVVILSPWHPTVTILPKPFTIRTECQRNVFIVSISWHGCGNVWQKHMRIILCWTGVARCHLSSPSCCVEIMVWIELGINRRWKYRD